MRFGPCEVFLFILASIFLNVVKSYDMGASGYTSPPKEGALLTSIALLKKVYCFGRV
jgi:hypothetical protein